MSRFGGNPNLKGGGKKGRSGRRSKNEELKYLKETVKAEALIELANSIVFKRLKRIDEDETEEKVKEIALPIVLKGITKKVDFTTKGQSIIYRDEQIENIAKRALNQKYYGN